MRLESEISEIEDTSIEDEEYLSETDVDMAFELFLVI